MKYFWKNNSIPVKVSALVMFCAIAYLFVVDGESFGAWTVFFLSLVFTILFKQIQDNDKH